ncbi:MAG: LLM class F420-dependent oxidoreductase [Chloroflexi bacterium]|nr:LLM class F420-dependent oxidoreductase [Chloroflexota bacterium]
MRRGAPRVRRRLVQLGAIFPQTEIEGDAAALRAFARDVEQAGYSHLLAFDHVLGVDPDSPDGWSAPYTHETPFHEPLLLFAHFAACTERLEFVTDVLVLPQRQALLVAQQAATLAQLAGGRLRLGVGVGWNPIEYEALGVDFGRRGRIIEEQIALMRALWSQEEVAFEGRYHSVHGPMRPRPERGAIPIWMGGAAPPVLSRVGRLAEGWFPPHGDPAALAPDLARVHQAADDAGRDPGSIGVEVNLPLVRGGVRVDAADYEGAARAARRWEESGVSHLSVNTMGAGWSAPGQHAEALERFREALARAA